MRNIPEELFVGFKRQWESEKTYLAYVSPYVKGKATKEVSIEKWRDKDIPTKILKNEFLEGFVLGKKAGDEGERKAWVRVLDPRNFEVEIPVDNLLHILEYADSKKGKKLQGKFIYAFDGATLWLLPELSPEYEEFKKLKEVKTKSSIGKDDVKPFEVYRDKNNRSIMYLGRFDTYAVGYKYNGKLYKELSDAFEKYFDDNPKQIRYDESSYRLARLCIEGPIQEEIGKRYWFYSGSSFYYTKPFPRILVEHTPEDLSMFDMNRINLGLAISKELHRIVKQEWKPISFEYFSKLVNSQHDSYVFSRKHAPTYFSYHNCVRYFFTVVYNEELQKYVVKRHFKEQYSGTIKEIYDFISPEYCEITLDNKEIIRWCDDFKWYPYNHDLL